MIVMYLLSIRFPFELWIGVDWWSGGRRINSDLIKYYFMYKK